MSSKLPRCSGRDVIKVLSKNHFEIENKKGSHVTMVNRIDYRHPLKIIVPDHTELRQGTLAHIVNESGIGREVFLRFISA